MMDIEHVDKLDLQADAVVLMESIDPAMRHSLDHEYVIRQAQQRLQGRSQSELQAGARYLDQFMRSAELEAQGAARSQLQSGAEQVFMNDPLTFIGWFEQYDLQEKQDFQNAEPATYFALLALLYATQSLDAGRQAKAMGSPEALDDFDRSIQDHLNYVVGERLTDAKELIAFILGMEFEGIFRRKQAKKASAAKHQDYAQLKEKIFAFVDSQCEEMPNRRAAFAAANEFEKEIEKVMNSDDPEHQIAKWIGAHRRAKRAN